MALQLSGSLNISGSITTETLVISSTASFSGTASWAENVVNGGVVFPYEGSAIISGSILTRAGAPITGSELLLNGNFDGNTDNWVTGSGVTYIGNAVQCLQDGGKDLTIQQDFSSQAYKKYKIKFTVSNLTGGVIFLYLGQGQYNDLGSFGEGTHEYLIQPNYTGTNTLGIASDLYGSIFGSYEISDVSLQELLEEPSPISIKSYNGETTIFEYNPIANTIKIGVNAGSSSLLGNNIYIGNYAGYNSPSDGEFGSYPTTVGTYIGNFAGADGVGNYGSNFIGNAVGYGATYCANSNFIGYNTGQYAGNCYDSNWFGALAGNRSISCNFSNFLGNHAGSHTYECQDSNFIGTNSGMEVTQSRYSNFIGTDGGSYASYSSGSNFIGYTAGRNAYGSYKSNFIGWEAGLFANDSPYSTFIGYRAGYRQSTLYPQIGSNNIIIGTNITLGLAVKDSVNIGGLIFGTGSYSTVSGTPYSGSSNGKVGINQPLPKYSLDVSGSIGLSDVLVLATSSILPLTAPTASLMASGSGSNIKPYFWNGTVWTPLF